MDPIQEQCLDPNMLEHSKGSIETSMMSIADVKNNNEFVIQKKKKSNEYDLSPTSSRASKVSRFRQGSVQSKLSIRDNPSVDFEQLQSDADNFDKSKSICMEDIDAIRKPQNKVEEPKKVPVVEKEEKKEKEKVKDVSEVKKVLSKVPAQVEMQTYGTPDLFDQDEI